VSAVIDSSLSPEQETQVENITVKSGGKLPREHAVQLQPVPGWQNSHEGCADPGLGDNLFGTTQGGGGYTRISVYTVGCGTVFKLSPIGQECSAGPFATRWNLLSSIKSIFILFSTAA
jgi:hypothetical protein